MFHDLLDPPFASGRTAEIYPWTLGKILKLFKTGWTIETAEQEAMVAREAHFAGLPVPDVGNIVEVGGRVGVVYHYLEDSTLLKNLGSRPWTLFSSARIFARLHVAIHSCVVPGLRSQTEILEERIFLAEPLTTQQKQVALRRLRDLPEANQLCHGDLHPDNVLVGSGRLTIVDWADASSGNPIADVAHSCMLMKVCPPPRGTPNPWMIDLGRRVYLWLYLRDYDRFGRLNRSEFAEWIKVVAAARLCNSPIDERDRLIRLTK